MEFEIEKDVPQPKIKRGGGKKTIYPFEDMTEIGDSFFVPCKDKAAAKKKSPILISRGTLLRKLHGTKFSTSVYERDGVWGVGVWRIE